MKQTIGVLAALAVLLVSSCASVGYVSFERLESGDINFPEEVRRVGVVNNMSHFDFSHLKGDLSRLPDLEGNGQITADTLAHLLASADYFEEVVICDSMMRPSTVYPVSFTPLSPLEADSLIKALDVDVLFSLDRVKVELSMWKDYGGWNGRYYGGVKSVITPILFAYIPGRETPWFAISDKDSLGYSRNESMTLGRFQKDASAYSAYMLMEHLLPSWKMVERNYYASGSVEMRDAHIYVQEENWEEAYKLWKRVYDTKKGKKKMMAAFNLAVYCEAHDLTEEADVYVEEALKLVKEGSYDQRMMTIYQLQLKNRIEHRKKLDMQMQRFE